MRRLLVLTPNPIAAASTRSRLAQFFPQLRAAGIEPVLRPFLDDVSFGVLYRRGALVRKLRAAGAALAGRAADLVRAVGADAVLIHREAALVGPPVVEWLLARIERCPIVFDLDDAIWVPYASPTYGARLSRLLKSPDKIHFTLAAARHIIAGNPYIADYARGYNRRVDVIPTVIDTEQFHPAPAERKVPVLGWIGTHSSLQYLRAIVPALTRLAARRAFVLRVVGGTLDAPGLPVENVPWSLTREVADFQGLDVGLYPLVEDAWSVGKSGFKAVQYMACGVPVVASPVGVTRDMIRDGVNGFLASDDATWVARLEALLDDAALRRRLGEAGRADAVERWSVAAHAPHFVALVTAATEART
jgi:glycosyltransferase involved in cell wall biosynthesis